MMIEYYEALERLKKNQPIIVLKGTKISNKSVALEAGKSAGAIRKDRSKFDKLIDEIEKAVEKQSNKKSNSEVIIEKYKKLYIKNKQLYKESLARELMLIDRLEELEKVNKV